MRYSRLFLAMMSRARRRVPDDLEELELQGGVKVKMPKADAETYRASRAKDKAERDKLADEAAAARKEKKAAEDAKAEADRQVAIEKAAAKGDIENVRKLATEETRAKLEKRERAAIREHLRAKILQGFPKLDADPLEDTIDAVAKRFRMNAETDEIEAVDPAGQLTMDSKTGRPMTADAVLADFAKTRPHLLKLKAPPGDGDISRKNGDKDVTHTISHNEQQKLMRDGKWTGSDYAKAAKGGTLRITDD